MRCLTAALRFSFVALVASLGCGASSEPGAPENGGGEGGSGPDGVSLVLSVHEFNVVLIPLPGALVCEFETDNCVHSDADGVAVITLPANEEVAFTVELEGYGSWLFANVTDEHFPSKGSAEMATHEQLKTFAAQIDTPYPWTTGVVGLQHWPSRAGVRFIPIGPTVDAVGDVFYFDAATREYSLEQESTSFWIYQPYYPLASGGFTDVAPGVHQFELAGETAACHLALWAWPGDAPNRIRIPVLEGYTTYGSMRCDDPPQ